MRASGLDAARASHPEPQYAGSGIGYCLDVLDLFLAKVVAAREKDREFCIALLQYGYVNLEAALALVDNMPLDAKAQQTLRATIRRWARNAGRSTA